MQEELPEESRDPRNRYGGQRARRARRGDASGGCSGNRLPTRTRELVTDGLGLVTLLIAATSAMAVLDPDLSDEVGDSAPMLIVLGAVLIGGIIGSLLRLEARVEGFGGWLQRRLAGETSSEERHRFIEGFVVSSLIFCTGPLTILGALNDGLGNGADQLFLKSALDGFAAIAFAAAFGWGVAASAITVVVVQGSLTAARSALGRRTPRRAPGRDHRHRWAAAGGHRATVAPHPGDPGGRPFTCASGGSGARRAGGGHTLTRTICPRFRM